MPSHYRLDARRNWMPTAFTGSLTVGEIRAHLEQESRDGLTGRAELIDITAAQVALTPAEVREIIEVMRDYGSRLPLGPAAILVKDDFSYGMARMLEMLIEDVCEVRPFRTLAEAEKWLQQARTRPGPARIRC